MPQNGSSVPQTHTTTGTTSKEDRATSDINALASPVHNALVRTTQTQGHTPNSTGGHNPDKSLGNHPQGEIKMANKFDLLENLEKEGYGGDKETKEQSQSDKTIKNGTDNTALNSEGHRILKETIPELNQEENSMDKGYSQSDSKINTDRRHKRKQYQKRCIMPSNRVTRSVAKKTTFLNTV